MGFWLKKVAEYWLMPVPLCLLLILLGWWRIRRGRTPGLCARVALGLGFAVLLLGSNTWISIKLIEPLERAYPPAPTMLAGDVPPELAACRYVVVLGAGHADDTRLPALGRLYTPALGRLTEALRILRHLPGASLVLSGPSRPGGVSHAAVLAAAAESLGAPRSRMILVDTAYDTAQEAAAVRRLAGNGPVALVTSAAHLPRAAALFRHQGIAVYPCPADFLGKPASGYGWGYWRCDSESLERTTVAVRERLGALWARLRGEAD